MEKTRYFGSANRFNVDINFWSGNIFPIGDQTHILNFLSVLWVIFIWFLKLSYFLTTGLGSFYFANLTAEEAFKKTGAIAVVCAELIIPTVYLNFHRKDLRYLINGYNDVLIDSDNLRRLVRETVEPYKNGLKFYLFASFGASSSWAAAPILLVFNNDRFTYANFTVPAYLPGEPFGVNIFIAGVIFQVVGSCSVNLGKVSIDVYVTHLIAVLSAEYKYLRAEIAEALSRDKNEEDDSSVVKLLQSCVEHHCSVIKIGQELNKLLAFHIGATYFTCILKFCFLAFGVIKFGSANIEKAAYLFYTAASIMQVFLVCSCIQELLDVSTSVTDDAFHEKWHVRERTVKQIFCTIEASNRMECRLSAYRIVDLVVPTLASILSKSYSVCLLLLKVD